METKKCKNCGLEKPTTEFHCSDAVRGYLSARCKECDREKARRYYHEHPEHAERVRERARGKRRSDQTPEEKRAAHAAYMRQYLADHPEARERANQRSKEWNASHPPSEERREQIRQWQKANPVPGDRKRRNTLRHLYGIGPDEYKAMLDAQGEKCALCGTIDGGRKKLAWKWGLGTLSIDHCHTTGKVRGLLCHMCNSRLGAYEKLRDGVGLARVEEYLNADRSPTPP